MTLEFMSTTGTPSCGDSDVEEVFLDASTSPKNLRRSVRSATKRRSTTSATPTTSAKKGRKDKMMRSPAKTPSGPAESRQDEPSAKGTAAERANRDFMDQMQVMMGG